MFSSMHWSGMQDYRRDWHRMADRERLAYLACDDPNHFLPGDVAWVRDKIKALVQWFAAGLGDQSPGTSTPYGLGRRQQHGA